MSHLILLGSEESKRTVYLQKEAALAGIEMEVLDWNGFPGSLTPYGGEEEKVFLKIDPPLWDSCHLEELSGLAGEYMENLRQLSKLGREKGFSFLNEPEAIMALLDKRGCKRRLKAAGIPVTEELEGEFSRLETLLEAMREQRIFQVFIKPDLGSGAAGVMALRYDPGKGRMALYTCSMEEPKTCRLVNTKRLRCFTDREQVRSMVERLLETDCMVERWYAKAEYGRFSYDLRVVVQDGEMDFALARLASGPITNLQLNNHPLRADKLGLSREVWEEVRRLCLKAAECFPGLRSAGVDVLLERGRLRPRLIEMNGQGDLIYQDLYGENRIYRRQAGMMRAWMEENCIRF